MEWTAENAGTPDPGSDPVSELGTPARPETTAKYRHPARTVAASLTAVALLAAGVGIVATRGGGSSRPPLVLTPGAAPGKEEPASLDDGNGSSPYRFRLAITAPDLGSDAPVARLVAPAVDQARVRALADILGLDGSVTATGNGGWQVLDQTSVLSVEPTTGGWAFSYGLDAGVSSPGSVPGSDGSGVSSDPGSADGSGGSGTVDPSTGEEPPNVKPVAPPTIPLPPEHLPDAAGAERIARALLERLGVADDSWSATVPDTNGDDGVACAPEPCALSKTVATQRTVVLSPMFDSIAVSGISWQVQIGDNGKVLGVYGTWTTLRTLDRYPLRPVLSVFADLVAGKGTIATPVPMSAVEVDGAAPDHVIAPISVSINRITRGLAVMPASDDGVAVVDLIPTYVFTGTTDGGGEVVQELVAVEATVAPPVTSPGPPSPGKPLPDDPGATSPPVGKPEPQPLPATEPTVSGR